MKLAKVIIILGPTSSGKSDLAVRLAKKLEKDIGKQSELISVDSRQIYKGMDLGTGKVEGKWEIVDNEVRSFPSARFASPPLQGQTSPLPVSPPRGVASSKSPLAKGRAFHSTSLRSKSPALLTPEKQFLYKNIPHHLIDFQDPRTHSSESKKYTVVHFRKDALKLIKDISSRGKIPMIVGGTGFWISALIDNPRFPKVKPNEKLRIELEEQSSESLFKELQKQDPQRAKKIDSQNKYRLIRALEICQQLGTVPKPKNNPPKNIEFLQIGLDWPVEKLAEKIKKRLASRWTDGMIEEIKNLKKQCQMSWEDIQAFGLAYYWIPRYLQGELTDSQGNVIKDAEKARNELLDRVYFAEKNYAKRQRTWFKRDKRIVWENDLKEILKLTKKFLK